MTNPAFIFWGTPDISVDSLEALKSAHLLPTLIVTAPDSAKGRNGTTSPSEAKAWALLNNIPVLSPEKIKTEEFLAEIAPKKYGVPVWDLFVVVAYGKILPQTILSLPKHGTINMHPSLLPRHRGPSPIESQILTEQSQDGVGVSIMLLDEEMDHGPVLAQTSVGATLPSWPIGARALRKILGEAGGELLTSVIPSLVTGEIVPIPQDHTQATFCVKSKKEDALIDLSSDAETNFRKILAFEIWPRAYFFADKCGTKVRTIIAAATLGNGSLVITRVIPEGKKEMSWDEFQRGL